MKRLYPILSALLLLAACTESDTDRAVTQQLQNSPDFHATFEPDDTRTFVDEKVRLLWTEGDLISIFTNTLNQKYEFDGETGDNSGTFTPISSSQFGSGSSLSVDANYAVYPYNQSTKISYDGELSIELPATQAYAENSFGVNANTMVAVTQSQNDNFLSFKNLGGFLKLQLYGDVTVKSIQLEGNNGEKIAGGATVTAKYGKNPTLTMDSDATTSITLDCGAGVKLSTSSSSATEFWIVVPPVTFSKGFTITITDTEGGTMTKSTTKSYTVERNVIKSMAAFKVETTDPTTPPANEIWYTSIDGKVVIPDASTFGSAKIVSNVYENGKGIITFDGEITQIPDYAFLHTNFEQESTLQSVIIPNSVTSIGYVAFGYCSELTNVALPENITIIGDSAFFGCSSLSSFTIPDCVAEIGGDAFYGCSSLTSIIIPESVEEIGVSAFQSCSNLRAFYGKFASSDNRYLIIDGVLNSFAPAGLTDITIPEGVICIGSNAFNMCSNLRNITIPKSVKSIGYHAFYGCRRLANITIPDGVVTIEGNVFSHCSQLAAFYGKYASPDNISLIVDGVLISFAPAGIKSYTIPKDVTSIGSGAFAGCVNISSIVISEEVLSIGEYAFFDCQRLSSITIPENVTSIEMFAFQNCKSLSSISIPKEVVSIGQSVFLNCASLKEVYCKPIAPPSSQSYVFEGNASNRKIYVPTSSVDAYKSSDGWSAYASDIVGYDFDDDAEPEIPNNQIWYTSTNGAIIEPNDPSAFGANIVSNVYKDGKGVITFDEEILKIGPEAFTQIHSLQSIVIPNSVNEIGFQAFSFCSGLTSVTIPNSVEMIGDEAFLYCQSLTAFYGKYASDDNRCLIVNGVLNSFAPVGLTSYSIPNTVTTIGEIVFFGCDDLTSVTIPNSVTAIKENAFSNCGLTSIAIPDSVTSIGVRAFSSCTSLKSVMISNSVTAIGDQAFIGTAIKSINIPDKVTSLGINIFQNCSSLATIYGKYASSDHKCLIVDGVLNSFAPANIASYTIPEDVVEIGQMAFIGCTSLTSVTIPNSVMKIWCDSFQYCSNLEIVNCKPTTPPSIIANLNIFDECSRLKTINVPHKSVANYKNANGWSEYSDKIVGCEFFGDYAGTEVPNNQIWYTSADERVLPTKMNAFAAKIISNVYENGRGVITCDRDIELIEREAFGRASTLIGVAIPKSVMTIRDSAFAFTGLKSITIPDGVTSIGPMAFTACMALESFYGKYASSDNRFLEKDGSIIAFAQAGLTSYTIPNTITDIGDYAFYGSVSITSIVMPEGVKKIGAGAFASCYKITDITIPKNVVEIGAGAFDQCENLEVVHCRPANPPSIGRRVFELCDKLRRIEVPHTSIDSYKTASGWSEYADKIDGDV